MQVQEVNGAGLAGLPAQLRAFGNIVIDYPPQESLGGKLVVVDQPVLVSAGAELAAGVDYSGWRLCYGIDAAPGESFCAWIAVESGGIYFHAVGGAVPPKFSFLDPTVVHRARSWFEADVDGPSGTVDRWGHQKREFNVRARPEEALGKAIIAYPPDGVTKPATIAQPFEVSLGVELAAGVDYSQWRICYTIDGATAPPFCAGLIVSDAGVTFAVSQPPPVYAGLDTGEVHRAVAWFQDSHGGAQWGRQSHHFRVWP